MRHNGGRRRRSLSSIRSGVAPAAACRMLHRAGLGAAAMDTRQLGKSDLRVSRLCLGGNLRPECVGPLRSGMTLSGFA